MPSEAYNLMQTFNDEAKAAVATGNYDRSMVMENAVSTVNNFLHGRYPTEWLPMVHRALTQNSNLDFTTDNEKEHYADAILLTEALAEQLNIPLT